jgi:hypothetical protein
MADKLTLADIKDLRAYERERDEFRSRVMAEKKTRRVGVGPIVTLIFENRDTVRLQIQEMARAERMLRDEQIQEELDIYNPLIPDAGELSATLFVELTTKDDLMTWLPKLVGIEASVELLIGSSDPDVVRCEPDAAHAGQLTRTDMTATVHYIRFRLTPQQIERFAAEPVVLAVNHVAYAEGAHLPDDTKGSLVRDLRGL